ncbi:aminomethyl-transferring glycine dehydrogenase subunit GcvPA [Papillibacter cinnamivorans]|uniref:Probable glycine dehydrogenase (decarboxylating) subunit 1 n=1 Tax=Papillibacter cinnamivorans DSM 12816 TaxID=1122930 RepID=A0A1W1ZNI9_9FIRM|nr:aminomethyl-transferring glycine dehydrogenase subunit GcvPA [Papillibacter cinnamivorans]SMC49678.1 glycine dehydrogenase subunit 1 [Papillibacter cinnamivorans DSM 12816]
MGGYIPSPDTERREMLAALGLESASDLFSHIPGGVKLSAPLDLPGGKSELEVRREVSALAARNTVFPTVLRGAGAYRHYIPSVVKYIPAKEEFLTAYTPYQAEISQGILQAIFEYQTMICELTGMDVSNASVYDGASAAAEAAAMCRERKRTKTLVSAAASPETIATLRTYSEGAGAEVVLIPAPEGKTDPSALVALLDGETACVYIQQPNFFGLLEPCEALAAATHTAGAKFVMGVNPISLGLIKSPSECGADVAVGEGQPLGLPLSWGGPYLGFMAASRALMRRLPGRLVGQTHDAEGNRVFVLTLQAREQHIRREKAGSNICSNEALCALTAAVYMAAMGPGGVKDAASQSVSKAHYLAGRLCRIPGVSLAYPGEFFHEFVTTLPVSRETALAALEKGGILGGLPVDRGLLWCVTEVVSRAELDKTAEILEEVCRK